MEIERIVVGFLKENCYVVTKEDKSVIIDPGDEAEKIISTCKDKKVIGVYLTHRHFDHVGALNDILDYFKIDVLDNPIFSDMEILATPGHTSDSVSYYFAEEKILFSGDFLFKGTIGRVDLPTGDIKEMEESLEEISKYPKETVVYPGHGESTVLGEEIPHFTEYLQE